jgi:hypothetical protein
MQSCIETSYNLYGYALLKQPGGPDGYVQDQLFHWSKMSCLRISSIQDDLASEFESWPPNIMYKRLTSCLSKGRSSSPLFVPIHLTWVDQCAPLGSSWCCLWSWTRPPWPPWPAWRFTTRWQQVHPSRCTASRGRKTRFFCDFKWGALRYQSFNVWVDGPVLDFFHDQRPCTHCVWYVTLDGFNEYEWNNILGTPVAQYSWKVASA